MVWFGRFGLVWFGRLGLVGLVWYGRFGLVWSLVPLKVAKASLELHLGTIPVGVRSVGSNIDKAIPVQLQLHCLLELSLAIRLKKTLNMLLTSLKHH